MAVIDGSARSATAIAATPGTRVMRINHARFVYLVSQQPAFALMVMDALERDGVYTRVMSAIEMRAIAEPYIRRRAIRHLEKGRVVIFSAGTGNPYFSTDTAAALRATEIGADVVIKATKVDGVYDSDPKKNSHATKFDSMTHLDFLSRRLTVMDSTAVTLCMENNLPILVLNFWDTTALTNALRGELIGTLVSGD